MTASKQAYCFVYSLYLIGLVVFCTGFFLTRLELGRTNSCEEHDTLRALTKSSSWSGDTKFSDSMGVNLSDAHPSSRPDDPDICWTGARYDRVLFVVIDALRFDFLAYNLSLPVDTEPAPYQNRMSAVHAALQRAPTHSRIFRFRADPPTVTMQRLKGVMTGSFPTFIDVRKNFHSTTIDDDNWLSQILKKGPASKLIRYAGDDTWLSLFPALGHNLSHPLPSFNVHDLHTVDEGCVNYMWPLLCKDPHEGTEDGEWKLLITHFLGVDHVGHRHGARHPEMEAKLTQLNEQLAALIEYVESQQALDTEANQGERRFEQLQMACDKWGKVKGPLSSKPAHPKNTLLVVMGDHGMTEDGNHGGASDLEQDAGLFIFSSLPLTQPGLRTDVNVRTIPQIDLVPTLSHVLGLPIPYSNMGKVIPSLIPRRRGVIAMPDRLDISELQDAFDIALGVIMNLRQVTRYIRVYDAAAGPTAELKDRRKHASHDAQLILDGIWPYLYNVTQWIIGVAQSPTGYNGTLQLVHMSESTVEHDLGDPSSVVSIPSTGYQLLSQLHMASHTILDRVRTLVKADADRFIDLTPVLDHSMHRRLITKFPESLSSEVSIHDALNLLIPRMTEILHAPEPRHSLVKLTLSILDSLAEDFRARFARFDEYRMGLGTILMITACGMVLIGLISRFRESNRQASPTADQGLAFRLPGIEQLLLSLIPILAFAAYIHGLFSNSYILNEDLEVRSLSIALTLCLAIAIFSSRSHMSAYQLQMAKTCVILIGASLFFLSYVPDPPVFIPYLRTDQSAHSPFLAQNPSHLLHHHGREPKSISDTLKESLLNIYLYLRSFYPPDAQPFHDPRLILNGTSASHSFQDPALRAADLISRRLPRVRSLAQRFRPDIKLTLESADRIDRTSGWGGIVSTYPSLLLLMLLAWFRRHTLRKQSEPATPEEIRPSPGRAIGLAFLLHIVQLVACAIYWYDIQWPELQNACAKLCVSLGLGQLLISAVLSQACLALDALTILGLILGSHRSAPAYALYLVVLECGARLPLPNHRSFTLLRATLLWFASLHAYHSMGNAYSFGELRVAAAFVGFEEFVAAYVTFRWSYSCIWSVLWFDRTFDYQI